MDALSHVLEAEYEVSTVVANPHVALLAAASFLPDIALIDLEPANGGQDLGRRLQQADPELHIIYLTNNDSETLNGAFISKKASVSDLLRIVRTQSGRPAAEQIATHLNLSEASDASCETNPLLSQREREVIMLLVAGLRMKEVATAIGISPRTVAFHKYRVMRRHNLKNNNELTQFAVRMRIIRR
ncbi:MAG TPA: response regulator transcription factor [Acetobacteraceae bacterium]|nr:response regulator transcription factor [Acetobacteraceae bacterium]